MIVVDTSALIAVLKSEPEAAAMLAAMSETDRIVIGAPTKFELLLVMARFQQRDGVLDAQSCWRIWLSRSWAGLMPWRIWPAWRC